jgi:hypothetical protein
VKIGSRTMPRFDGDGNAYCWMINLYQYLESIRVLKEEWL